MVDVPVVVVVDIGVVVIAIVVVVHVVVVVVVVMSGAEERLPVLTEEILNLTMVAGREAVLSCHVNHLGSYKVREMRKISFLKIIHTSRPTPPTPP